MSLVDWAKYSNEELRYQRSDLENAARADRRQAGDWSEPSENRRHASERAANCAEMIREIDEELDRR